MNAWTPFALAFVLACGRSAPPPAPARVATPPSPRAVAAVALARTPPTRLTLPPSTRPDDRPIGPFHPQGTLTVHKQVDTHTVVTIDLPVHANLFPSRQVGARTFGFYAPPDLQVALGGQPLAFKRNAEGPGTWGYDHDKLLIGLPPGAPVPSAAEITLTWPKAEQAERALHLASSGLDPAAFALRTLALDMEGFTGVLLPAPATAEWALTVPAGGVLSLRTTLLPPAMADVRSDGATVRIEVVHDGTAEVLTTQTVAVDRWDELKLPLDRWAGQAVTIRALSEPGASPTADLVFLHEPTIHVPTANPKRVVVAFIDTVRRDHLGMYGYARPTTPKLDAWAGDALRFDDHRTIAPWTLPSARALMVGAEPERYYEIATLPARLAAAGFLTDGLVANAYLAPTFDMHNGFGHYRFDHLRPAKKTVDHAIDLFERYPDRDLLVYVQFMEAHLPYNEPPAYRDLFAGAKPKALDEVSKVELDKIGPGHPQLDAVREYVVARYDQNLRVLDDELARLFEAAGPDATVVLFSDHGEELWDHGGFEHGHTVYDELLRVPLVIRDPHLPAGVFAAPTSMIDVAPTVLELVGLPRDGMAGASLVPAAFGDAAAEAALVARPRAFGRPLYGDDAWGYVAGTTKWWSRGGAESMVALDRDPGEQRVADGTGAPVDPFAAATGEPLRRVWRVTLQDPRQDRETTLSARFPGGWERAWLGYDPKARWEGTHVAVDGEVVTVRGGAGEAAFPETIYLLPKGDPLHPGGLQVRLDGGTEPLDGAYPGGKLRDEAGADVLIGPIGARWKLTVDLAWVPAPFGREVGGRTEELAGQLEQLGYAEPR